MSDDALKLTEALKSQTIIIGSDHAGFQLKAALIRHLDAQGIVYQDIGCYSPDRVDYPNIAFELAKCLAEIPGSKGVLCCGSGIGVAMAANRFSHCRAVTANDMYTAKMSRLHNDSNVLCMGERFIAASHAIEIMALWLTTPFEGGRHQQRVDLMSGKGHQKGDNGLEKDSGAIRSEEQDVRLSNGETLSC